MRELIDLNGPWGFAYRPPGEPQDDMKVPGKSEFEARMPVPGYWDDHLDELREFKMWSNAAFNPMARGNSLPLGTLLRDAALPFLLGIGWYRKLMDVPSEWAGRIVNLCIGGVVLEAWVFINGERVLYHCGHSTPFHARIDMFLKCGETNEIVVAVANTRTDRSGTVIRGYKGCSGGIYRGVSLKVCGQAAIDNCHIVPSPRIDRLSWNVELAGDPAGGEIRWSVRDPRARAILGQGIQPVDSDSVSWTTGCLDMKPWSDKSPELYDIEVSMCKGKTCHDILEQKFGLRRLCADGTRLLLNGRPIMLRGVTEHAYFPETCTPPSDVETYRRNLMAVKRLGFNWLRFHTWTPSEEYMQAADELGMLIQVEPPVNFEEAEWVDIVTACRKHPSVVIYCCGNEEFLNEERIEYLRRMAQLCKELSPDSLFSPQEAMRGVEYLLDTDETDPGDLVKEPFLHHPQRLAGLKAFSDVFTPYLRGHHSYHSVDGDSAVVDKEMTIYGRPCFSHEAGIHSSYINLDLVHRYEGTRIGTDLFRSVRDNLEKVGLLNKASRYYANSCAWMRLVRKHNLETVRRSRLVAGYDFLGAIDCHWHRTGYACGIMNEFYEMKQDETPRDVLRYNGESILTVDLDKSRNYQAGSSLKTCVDVSLFAEEPLRTGTVCWSLRDERKRVLRHGEKGVENIPNGAVSPLVEIRTELPEVERPSKMTLGVFLAGDCCGIENEWDLWVFPDRELIDFAAEADDDVVACWGARYAGLHVRNCREECQTRLVSGITPETVEHLENGGTVVLLGTAPFESLPLSFQPALAGRSEGNLATVISDHPLMNDFPHEGFCDWQFFRMMHDATTAVVFDGMDEAFDPIIEIVSSFKLIRKQSALFELRVGRGRLLVCSLKLAPDDPASEYLFDLIVRYVAGPAFNPRVAVSPGALKGLIGAETHGPDRFVTDEARDPNALAVK